MYEDDFLEMQYEDRFIADVDYIDDDYYEEYYCDPEEV